MSLQRGRSVEREPIPRKPTTGRYSLLPAWLGRRSDDGKKPFRSLIEVSDRYERGHRGDGNAAKACEKLGVNCVVRGAFALTRSGSALHGIHAMNADLRLDGCRDLRWLRNVHRDGRTSVCPQRVALDIGALERSALCERRARSRMRSMLRIVANYVERAGLVRDANGFHLERYDVPPLAAIEGCGQRATYTVADNHLVLTNRVVLSRP